MKIKDALFREIKYAVCGAGGALQGIVAADHVKLDARLSPSSLRDEADYPWLVFRRVRNAENNQVKYARVEVEIEAIGLRSSAAKGDDLLEEIREALIDHFAGKRKTWGKFTVAGDADPDGGLLMTAEYQDTVEGYDEKTQEKYHTLTFSFTYLRQ